ncbi:MAG: EAL domain-containing protein, partial [Desulfoferrobacter sp.]
YLKRFPINTLKIDRSLVRHIPANPDDTAIASAIISLGKSLKLRVVAEGVETQEQLSFFRNQECDEVQGYLFSHPLPPKEMTKLLQQKAPFPRANLYEIGVSATST